MTITKNVWVHFMTLALSVLLLDCSSNFSAVRGSLEEALAGLDGGTEGTLLDADGDGIPDTIDTDGDGIGDLPFDPGDTSGGDPSDPTVPLRDPNGSCVDGFVGATTLAGPSGKKSLTSALSGSHAVVIIGQASSENSHTVDLSAVTGLQRVIVKMTGNSNTVMVKGAAMNIGFCNDLAGGSNALSVDANSSGPIVDLQSGSGNNNGLDSLFIPSDSLIYSLSGKNNCVSGPPGTNEIERDNNQNGSFYTDTATCN